MFKRNILKRILTPPPKKNKRINQRFIKGLIALLAFVLLSSAAFAQSISGTVMDSSKAVLPGAEVTLKNDGTGVESKATTNNSGIYNFPNLQIGTYTVTAESNGFQRSTLTDVRVGIGSQINLPFELAVLGTVTEVSVTGSADSIILEAGSSTGTVIQEESIARLPLVANDILDAINMLGGAVESSSPVFYAMNQTIAGVTANNINITRDGISVNEIRYNSGLTSPARLNPDLVGEFKMVLSPVDAELGRGAGQVQMTTRSGTNAFHGSGVWNIQNTALDSYSYNDKHNRLPEAIDPLPWRNLHNYTLSFSGPIIRNKTFFFVTWDQAIARTKSYMRPAVLTNCMRKGIYRWFGNTISANGGITTNQVTVSTATNPGPNQGGISPTRPVVHLDGTPYYDYVFPTDSRLDTYSEKYSGLNTTGTVYNDLHYQSIFGPLSADALAQVAADPVNCSQYLPNYHSGDPMERVTDLPLNANFGVTGTWDDYRTGLDQSGYVSRFTALMPTATDFQVGDGLNTAGHGWVRVNKGTGNIFGQSTSDDARKAITFKIDHNLNSEHRLSGTYSYEVNRGEDGERTWPAEYNSFGGMISRKPQTFQVNLTSTLRPTLLNELRVGLSRTESISWQPILNPENGSGMADELIRLLGNTGNNPMFPTTNDMPILVGTGSGSPGGGTTSTGSYFYPTNSSHPYGSRGNVSTSWGGHDPRWTFSDTVTWMKGSHSFKGGFEYRWQQSFQRQDGPPSLGAGVTATPQIMGGVIASQSPNRNLGLTNPNDGSWAYDYWPDMPSVSYDYRRTGVSAAYPSAQAAGGPYAHVYNMLTYFSGSIGSLSQYFYAVDSKNPHWNDPQVDGINKFADLRNQELALFFKDDWKITRDVTLNLGVRWEYYGVPWEQTGMAAGIRGGVNEALGITSNGNGWDDWMPNGSSLSATYDSSKLTRQILVGPHSPNEDLMVHGKDLNNVAPHIGFSWALPWFGVGKTTLRGGYSISYVKIANYDNTFGYATFMAYQPTINQSRTYSSFTSGCLAHIPGESATGCYLDLTNAGKLLPLYSASTGWVGWDTWQQIQPLDVPWVGKRNESIQVFDPNIVNPYIQNVNMSLTRQLTRALTLDIRYIGTLSRKSVSGASTGLDVNTNNLINSGLMDELIKLRRDGPSTDINDYPIMNRYILPNTWSVGTNAISGSHQVWNSQLSNLATGGVNGIVSSIRNANCDETNGSVCTNQLGYSQGNVLRYGGAPENLIMANPQYSAVNVQRNGGTNNYHSMQVQVTMRPVHGLNFQATYTWSRTLGRSATPVDYRNWDLYTYDLTQQHRSHALTHNGSYTLPLGANGYILRNSTGAIKKAVEGWQIGWMGRFSSGMPMSLGGGLNTLWNSSRWVQVGDIDTKQGKVDWDEELGYAFYMGRNRYDRVVDPQCFDTSLVNPALVTNCASSTRALIEVDPNGTFTGYRSLADYNNQTNPIRGNLIYVNATPGTTGNVRQNIFTGQGQWTLDGNMSKSIEFMEGKRIEIRVDASNILNHANPSGAGGDNGARNVTVSNPALTINSTTTLPFAYITTKAGKRAFQARIRLSF